MRMTFGGAPEIQASREHVWKSLLDPDVVASAAPAVERVEATDPTHFKVIAGLGVGSLKVRFVLNVELFDLVELTSAKMRVRGKAPGSTLDAITSFALHDAGSGITRLEWTAQSDVGGTVASVGARLLEGTARRLAESFWEDFAAKVAESAGR